MATRSVCQFETIAPTVRVKIGADSEHRRSRRAPAPTPKVAFVRTAFGLQFLQR